MSIFANDQQVDLALVTERAGPLGPLIRPLVGLDRTAANKAFANYLDNTKFSVDQVRFVSLTAEELAANRVMEPAYLDEGPYVDQRHIDMMFPNNIGVIADILRDFIVHAVPGGLA